MRFRALQRVSGLWTITGRDIRIQVGRIPQNSLYENIFRHINWFAIICGYRVNVISTKTSLKDKINNRHKIVKHVTVIKHFVGKFCDVITIIPLDSNLLYYATNKIFSLFRVALIKVRDIERETENLLAQIRDDRDEKQKAEGRRFTNVFFRRNSEAIKRTRGYAAVGGRNRGGGGGGRRLTSTFSCVRSVGAMFVLGNAITLSYKI